jgi:hypothetical protein
MIAWYSVNSNLQTCRRNIIKTKKKIWNRKISTRKRKRERMLFLGKIGGREKIR